jgi:predicted kinase
LTFGPSNRRRKARKSTRLIVFAGLPGSGKSSIAQGLGKQLKAVWLRIDSIEQAIRESAIAPGSVEDAG